MSDITLSNAIKELILEKIQKNESSIKQIEKDIEQMNNDINIQTQKIKLDKSILIWVSILVLIGFIYFVVLIKNININIIFLVLLTIILLIINIHTLYTYILGKNIKNIYNDDYQSKYNLLHHNHNILIKDTRELYTKINKTNISYIISDVHIAEFKQKYGSTIDDTIIIKDEFKKLLDNCIQKGITFFIVCIIYDIILLLTIVIKY